MSHEIIKKLLQDTHTVVFIELVKINVLELLLKKKVSIVFETDNGKKY